MLQFGDITREIALGFLPVATQRTHGGLVSAGRSTQAQVNAVGVQLCQRPKGFSHHKWGVVGQHDAARSDPNALGATRKMAHNNGCRRTGNAIHVVVLCHPVTGKTQRFGMLRCAQGNGQCIGHGIAFAYGDKI